MISPTARPLCCRSLGPDQPRWRAFAQARLPAPVDCCSSGRTCGYGSRGRGGQPVKGAGMSRGPATSAWSSHARGQPGVDVELVEAVFAVGARPADCRADGARR